MKLEVKYSTVVASGREYISGAIWNRVQYGIEAMKINANQGHKKP